jgi:hypothetical protein
VQLDAALATFENENTCKCCAVRKASVVGIYGAGPCRHAIWTVGSQSGCSRFPTACLDHAAGGLVPVQTVGL